MSFIVFSLSDKGTDLFAVEQVIQFLRRRAVHDDHGDIFFQCNGGGGEFGDHAAGAEGRAGVARKGTDLVSDGRDMGDQFCVGIFAGVRVVYAVDVAENDQKVRFGQGRNDGRKGVVVGAVLRVRSLQLFLQLLTARKEKRE